MKITVIHHSADFDGLFCREIARKFLPDAELIGWDFGDKPLEIPAEGQIYILDLPVDRVFDGAFHASGTAGVYLSDDVIARVVWIDHHKSSIETHPSAIPGYRIDGVAACRLAWQYFVGFPARVTVDDLPTKQNFIDRQVSEPLAVRLAGEYDIWDEWREDWEQITAFQFALRSRPLTPEDWDWLLTPHQGAHGDDKITQIIGDLLQNGLLLQRYQQAQDASVVNRRSFLVEFEGLKFLALNTARCNSLTFAAKDVPETGHDALLAFYWNGAAYKVSLYHARHRTDIDLSQIAVKHSGGGHRGACGFESKQLPFIP